MAELFQFPVLIDKVPDPAHVLLSNPLGCGCGPESSMPEWPFFLWNLPPSTEMLRDAQAQLEAWEFAWEVQVDRVPQDTRAVEEPLLRL